MSHRLRPYQAACVGDALHFVDSVAAADEEGRVCAGAERRRLYAAPTGSGKTLVAVTIQKALVAAGLDAWVVTPSLEIARGFLREHGIPLDEQPTADEAVDELAATVRVATPTRMRNRCLDGRREVPDVWIVDEVHHAIEGNEVSGCNFNLAPGAVWIGFTATPYRGSPAGTKALRDAWGDPFLLLTYPEAVAEGACVVPSVEIVPLIDDDLVKIVGGEFQDKAASAAVTSKVDALAAIVARYWSGSFDVPTMVSVPSTDCVGELVSALDRLGIDAHPVTQNTKPADRQRAFEACKNRTAALVQIKVVSEGVDLPWLGRLVDARPMVSPVAWLQQLGRLTRPGHGPKHYVCVCRNVERHAYLLQGAIPRSAVAAAQAAFAKPSTRAAGRIVGLESLGKLKPIPLPLAGGVTSQMFAVFQVIDGVKHEWAILHDPSRDEPIVARRQVVAVAGEETTYSPWVAAPLPADFAGYATSSWRATASEKMKAWWKRSAAKFGLDPDAADTIKGRQFAALPVLKDTGLTMAVCS